MNEYNLTPELDADLEALYLYILSLLPVRELAVFEKWRLNAGSFEAIYFADEQELGKFGFPFQLLGKLEEVKREHSLEKIVTDLAHTGVKVLPYYDAQYPILLKEIYDAPPVLFYRGELFEQNTQQSNEPCIAIVGSRAMTPYGTMAIPRITSPLLDAGITIVSGLAYGVDSSAHKESVARGQRTIAVLGSGVDDESIYPRAHFKLAQEILDNKGLLLSEQPPFTPGLPYNFVARNRIIAGLSLGVVIVECKLKSGALITADYAGDFNRALYAVPGPIYSKLSDGPHKLIGDGAMLITSGQDILDDLAISQPQLTKQLETKLTNTEQTVLECIQDTPRAINEIAGISNLDISIVAQTITLLELKNLVKELGVKGYIKI